MAATAGGPLAYRPKDVAPLLGVSEDFLQAHPELFDGVKADGRKGLVLFPKRVIDAFLYGSPDGPEAPVEVVRRLIPALTPEQRRQVALWALQDGALPAAHQRG